MAEKKATKKVTTPKKPVDEKVFDVTSPGKTVASANSKPMIVSNRAVVRDPMVTPHTISETSSEDDSAPIENEADNAQKAQGMPVSKLRIEPLHSDVKAETGALVGGSPKAETPTSGDEDVVSESADDNSPSDVPDEAQSENDESGDDELDELSGSKKKTEDKAAAAEAAAEQKRREEAEAAIASKQYFVPINAVKKRRSIRALILVVMVFAVVVALAVVGPGKTLLLGVNDGDEPEKVPAKVTKAKQSNEKNVEPSKPEAPKTITYSELKTVASSDDSITMQVPTEYAESPAAANGFGYGQYKPDSTKDMYSSVGVAIESAGSMSELKAVKSTVIAQLKAKGQAYDTVVAGLRKNGLDAKLGDFTNYKSGVSADILPSQDALGNEAQGKLILLFGATKMYTVIIGADSAVWVANQTIFQQMIDSIVVK